MIPTQLVDDDCAKGMEKIAGKGDGITAMVQSANERLHLGVVCMAFFENGGDGCCPRFCFVVREEYDEPARVDAPTRDCFDLG